MCLLTRRNELTEQFEAGPENVLPSPKVSVVVPTYNRSTFLSRALDSVLAQTYTDFELIVVDDHSSDATQLTIGRYSNDPRVRGLRHERNMGQSNALNTGIAAARGEYVAFLDDDDVWLPPKLAMQVPVLDSASSKVGLVYGWYQELDEPSHRPIETVRQTLRGDIRDQMLALDVPYAPSTWLVRTDVARALGGFDENVLPNDVDFSRRLCERGWHVDFVPEIVAHKYEHSQGQMTDETPENLAQRAAFIRRHLAEFAPQLRADPMAIARIHSLVARCEIRDHRIRGMWSIAKAFIADPRRLDVKVGFYARRLYYLLRDATRSSTAELRRRRRTSRTEEDLY